MFLKNLNILWTNDRWKYVEWPDVIETLSDTKLYNIEIEALGFGLKFTTVIRKGDLVDTIVNNHKIH